MGLVAREGLYFFIAAGWGIHINAWASKYDLAENCECDCCVGLRQLGEMVYLVAQNLGLWHVTQRYDRDNHVRVVTSNLLDEYQSDLLKLDRSTQLLNTFQLPYDYASLMHFPAKVRQCTRLLVVVAAAAAAAAATTTTTTTTVVVKVVVFSLEDHFPAPGRGTGYCFRAISFFLSFFLCFFVSNITRKRLDRFA